MALHLEAGNRTWMLKHPAVGSQSISSQMTVAKANCQKHVPRPAEASTRQQAFII